MSGRTLCPYVVKALPLPIHGYAHFGIIQQLQTLRTGEVAALITVNDLYMLCLLPKSFPVFAGGNLVVFFKADRKVALIFISYGTGNILYA